MNAAMKPPSAGGPCWGLHPTTLYTKARPLKALRTQPYEASSFVPGDASNKRRIQLRSRCKKPPSLRSPSKQAGAPPQDATSHVLYGRPPKQPFLLLSPMSFAAMCKQLMRCRALGKRQERNA
ncbi:hypothetical protein HPB50_019540 [Hyalomma asiaticum]|uniref:Uncharacterized protein n=1 Tax=Hyalomma asiaticum TaxID=266040 RepID=A0ACB7SZT0_HYAAI|nr:hypothetical protein HPB50_019540 [Hyalomma asiaticum]